MGCAGCVCLDDCDYRHELDWDTRVELLEIELESLRIAIQELGKKFDKFEKENKNGKI
jgi:hypothetical protein